jgi:hypothetical protein
MNIHHCRSSARRLALLGAAAIALGGLASALAVGAATPPSLHLRAQAATPPFLRPRARATTPSSLRQMAQALARVHGYQVTMQTASSGSGTPLTATSTATVVRRGTTLRLHLTTTMHGTGQVSTLEEVFTGTHLCLRMSGRSAWSCSALPRSALARLQSVDPAQMARALGLGQRYVAVGRHTRQGHACLGYRLSLTAGGLHGYGTLWVAQATSLPVEEDTVSTMALRTGAPPLVVRTTQHWSRWNDPHLSIPSVPAS